MEGSRQATISPARVTPTSRGESGSRRAGSCDAGPCTENGWFGVGAKTEIIVGGHLAHFIFSDDRKSFHPLRRTLPDGVSSFAADGECPLSSLSCHRPSVRFRPIADIRPRRDATPVVSFYRPMTRWWVPTFTLAGLFHRQELDATVKRFCSLPLHWRWASPDDWPPQRAIGSDFRFARRGGFGFVVEVDKERLFLVPRGWDEPEWGLAVYDLQQGHWRDLGDLEPGAEHWVFPEPKEPLPSA